MYIYTMLSWKFKSVGALVLEPQSAHCLYFVSPRKKLTFFKKMSRSTDFQNIYSAWLFIPWATIQSKFGGCWILFNSRKMGPIASSFLLKYKSLNLLFLLYQTRPIRWTFVTHHLCYFSFEIVHIWLSIVSFHLRRYLTLQMTTFGRRRTQKDVVRILFQTCDISLTNSACKLERTIFNAIIRTLN